MSDANVIVWDIETVPDLRAAARMLNMERSGGRGGPNRAR
jgi:hypothetical protein